MKVKVKKIAPTIEDAKRILDKVYDTNYQGDKLTEECWNLDAYFAANILIHLIRYKEQQVGCPGTLLELDENFNPMNEDAAFEQWQEILDDMIKGFYLYCVVDGIFLNDKMLKKYQAAVNKAFNLFKEYFPALWI